MAHFANLDSDNKVVLVLFVDNSDCLGGNSNEIEAAGITHLQKHHPEITGTWKQTSYNKTFRKNYAGIGYTYDVQRDAFIPPKSYPSWVLNETTCDWESPVARPSSYQEKTMLSWNESAQTWDVVE
jgi:hypothetical protein